MKRLDVPVGCPGCGVSRRRFLRAGCAACVGAAGVAVGARPVRSAPAKDGAKIRIVFSLHAPTQPGPDWPNVGYDFRPFMTRVRDELTRRCPGMEFVSSEANGPEAAKKILAEDAGAGIDGYVVYQLNCWNRVVQTIAGSGRPVLYADFQYGGSGGFLVYTAAFLRAKAPNVGFVASSDLADLAEAVKCFSLVKSGRPVSDFVAATARVRVSRTPKADTTSPLTPDRVKTLSAKECLERMRGSRILAVRSQESKKGAPIMGIPLDYISFSEVNDAWKAADRDESKAIADRWEKEAVKIEGVTRETLEASAAMYLAQKAVLKKRGANAITINCLGGFYGGHIHAYPCLGFHELLNEGLVGACECDLRSTSTMVAMTHLSGGRPGYISDPVVDTAKRQIIYAHCVAHNRPFGPEGDTNPYEILTHSEDRQGASVRSVLPTGYMTTSLEFSQPRKQVLLHQARAVDNDRDDRACRTKLAAEPVGDIEKLVREWDQWGWHRVTYYGDLKEPVYALADALGWKVLEEA